MSFRMAISYSSSSMSDLIDKQNASFEAFFFEKKSFDVSID